MIPIFVKRKMRMAKATHKALHMAGFKIIPYKSPVCSIDDGMIWNWGWYGGELHAPILLNDPRYIHETTVCGCFEKYHDLMPDTEFDPLDLDSEYVICKNDGMKGLNKLFCRRDDAPDGYSVYQRFLGDDREEYRALMVGDKRIVSYRKLIEDKRNPASGKVFKMCGGQKSGEKPMPKEARKLARKVMRRSDLDILGLDIIVTGDGIPYLTELNSAPGIGPYTAERLFIFLQRLYGGEDEEERA